MNPEEYLDALLSLPNIDDELIPEVSPDGRWVAWTWFHTGATTDVFVAPTNASSAPIRMTDTDQNVFFVSWTPDSQAILVEQDQDGDERVQLFRVALDRPQSLGLLTEPKPNYYISGGELHPNENSLIYGANRNPETDTETEEAYIYRHDLKTGERMPLARTLAGVSTLPELNSTGTHILYARKDLHPAGRQVWLVDIDGREDRELFNFGDKVKTFAKWHPDGKRVLVLAETPTHRKFGIWTLPQPPSNSPQMGENSPLSLREYPKGHVRAEGEGGASIHWLIDDPTRDIVNVFVPENAKEAVIVENVQGGFQCSFFNLEEGIEQKLPPMDGNLIPLAPFSAEEWIGFFYNARQPGDIVRFRRENPQPENFISLTRVWERTELTPAQLFPTENFHWHSLDGLPIHGWLYRADGTSRGTIIYVHGGPTYHSLDFMNAEIQFFVSQGFNVLDPNYRGSTGYGLPFQQSILEDGWGGREQDDIRTGIEALVEAGIAKEGKVGITGTSYGGYSSWWAATHLRLGLVAASAPICGMTDLVIDYETTRPDLRAYSAEMMGGTPAQVPEQFAQRSPINFVENIRGKLLIIQGGQDPNVTPQNVETVVKSLNQHGIPFELLNFENEGHGIYKVENQRTLFLRLVNFFEEAFLDTNSDAGLAHEI